MIAQSLKWCQPPSRTDLRDGDIHLWKLSLDGNQGLADTFAPMLVDEERERTARYGCHATRDRFIIGRGLLRTILADYLSQKPDKIEFAVNQSGKPILRDSSAVHFNVSHSSDLIIIAVTNIAEVGVDVEKIRPFSNEMGLADRYFSPRECETLRRLGPEERTTAFFHAWTRKEACLKAMGVGLSYGLDRVEVSLHPEEPTRLLRIDGEENHAYPWTLISLSPSPGYVGALAVKSRECRLIGWNWPESTC